MGCIREGLGDWVVRRTFDGGAILDHSHVSRPQRIEGFGGQSGTELYATLPGHCSVEHSLDPCLLHSECDGRQFSVSLVVIARGAEVSPTQPFVQVDRHLRGQFIGRRKPANGVGRLDAIQELLARAIRALILRKRSGRLHIKETRKFLPQRALVFGFGDP